MLDNASGLHPRFDAHIRDTSEKRGCKNDVLDGINFSKEISIRYI